jgi:WD40 repeat protein
LRKRERRLSFIVLFLFLTLKFIFIFLKKVVFGDDLGQIKIYNQNSLVNSVQAHSSWISRIKQFPFNTNTNYVATCSSDGTVKMLSNSSSLLRLLFEKKQNKYCEIYSIYLLHQY